MLLVVSLFRSQSVENSSASASWHTTWGGHLHEPALAARCGVNAMLPVDAPAKLQATSLKRRRLAVRLPFETTRLSIVKDVALASLTIQTMASGNHTSSSRSRLCSVACAKPRIVRRVQQAPMKVLAEVRVEHIPFTSGTF